MSVQTCEVRIKSINLQTAFMKFKKASSLCKVQKAFYRSV